jgi:hypothetical protein
LLAQLGGKAFCILLIGKAAKLHSPEAGFRCRGSSRRWCRLRD